MIYRVPYNSYNLKVKVLDESEFWEAKKLVQRGIKIKFHRIPNFYIGFKRFIIIYSAFAIVVTAYSFFYNLILLTSWLDVIIGFIGLFIFYTLFSFIPSLHSYISYCFDSIRTNKLMMKNIQESNNYDEYLQKKRF